METDKQRIQLEKDFRSYIKLQHGEIWKKYSGSVLEATCVNFIKQKTNKLEKQLQEANIKALSHAEQAEDQKSRIKLLSEGYEDLEAENKKLKQASSILNTIGKDTPCPACENKMTYAPRLYHCNHCGEDFN